MPRRTLLARLMTGHTVTVETYAGTNGRGQDTYLPPLDVEGFLDDSRKLVLSQAGAEVVSEATFLTDVALVDRFTPESRVTLPDARVATVIRANATDTAGLAKRVEHVAVSLT